MLAWCVLGVLLTGCTSAARAEPVKADGRLVVAVLRFDAPAPADAPLAEQAFETTTAALAADSKLRLVERLELGRALDEQALGLTGLASPSQAIRVGKVVGAQLLVCGRVVTAGERRFYSVKIIGAETGLLKQVMVDVAATDAGEGSRELAKRVAATLRDEGASLLAAAPEDDPLAAMRKRLVGKNLPILSIRVTERHGGGQAVGLDPAVQTEMQWTLARLGFEIIDGPRPTTLPANVVEITGEATSEFSARIDNLVSCTARGQARLIEADTRKVLWIDRTTARAADLSEQVASKASLQAVGQQLAMKLAEHYADQPTPAPVAP